MSVAAVVGVGTGAALGAWARRGLAATLDSRIAALPLGTFAANLGVGFLTGVAPLRSARRGLRVYPRA